MTKSASADAPGHLWLLAVLLLVWHALLAADYTIARFALGIDLPSIDPVLMAGPTWTQIAWALAVWTGLAGAIFAMLRDDAAVLLFFAAFIGVLVALIGVELSAPPELVLGYARYSVYAALLLVPLIGWIYTRAMKRALVLH
ncbi:hypothetical protein [Pararhodobacter sp. SW119]|uniref:hypothetical protein n=1 Tax=Pararhodobacter sp. SW119 TaxID=2780075 RepID=UPI001AE071E2|nr:hypothetical protein [Pararhodobacter sp. SW119]